MKSSARATTLWVLLIFCTAVCIHSQSPSKKNFGSSISGKVTVKGKGVPGIRVMLRALNSLARQVPRYRGPTGTTDQDGNYRAINVPPGRYQVIPAAGAFVISGQPVAKTLIITEGETVE